MSRIPDDVVAAVLARAHHYCEAHVIGIGQTWAPHEFHHRQARGMGGGKGRDLDVAANLLYLHRGCHAHWHQHPDLARDLGYIVSQYEPTPA